MILKEVEGNNRHKRARGDLSWSFHALLQFQRHMYLHVIAVQINLAFHMLWSFNSSLLSSSAMSKNINKKHQVSVSAWLNFLLNLEIDRRWTSNSPRICATLRAQIGFDLAPITRVFLSSDAHFEVPNVATCTCEWRMSTWRLEWWYRKCKYLSCPRKCWCTFEQ